MAAPPTFTGIAPGRLDVMGGIADYSGSLVLQMPLNIYTRVDLRFRGDTKVAIRSTEGEAEVDLADLLKYRGAIVAKAGWRSLEIDNWALYVLGCLFVLLDERDFTFRGLDIEVKSEVPIGKGVSSSAALEVATMIALYKAFGLDPEREPLAVMAQRAENYVAGAPCGIMDQMAVHLGRKHTLLPILCQPYKLYTPVRIPSGFQFYGLDTGVKHAVGGGIYGRIRTAASMGWNIIQHYYAKEKISAESPVIPYKGYLANIPIEEFEKKYAALLPDALWGEAYLNKYGPYPQGLTSVHAEEDYPVLAATRHPVYEHHRITAFKNHLEGENPDPNILGEWMLESHQGYVDCGLSCSEADAMVDLVKQRSAEGDVFGARITGGGSGGTVCILARSEAAVRAIKSAYETATGRSSTLFLGSGEGAFFL